MSDEESFVILGTSPNSLNNGDSLRETSLPDFSKCMQQSNETDSLIDSQVAQEQKDKSIWMQKSIDTIERKSSMTKSNDVVDQNSSMQTSQVSNGKLKSINSTSSSLLSSTKSGKHSSLYNSKTAVAGKDDCAPSLATSFIMGEVSAEEMKTSIYSQFPSATSMEYCAQDAAKMQNFMAENMELKVTLASVNANMKLFYKKTQERIEEQQRLEREYKQQMQDLQREIATLRNENLELKRDVETKMDLMKLTEELYQKDHSELTKGLSEKSAQIENMRIVIQKLEQSQLASFEYIPKNDNDTKEKPDYIDRLEHERVLKDQMSFLLAENGQLKDMQKQHIEELINLKGHLTTTEERMKQQQADIELLRANDAERAELFAKYEEERTAMKSELLVLREQLDIYSKDFELERTARENIAGEKDRLLQDLRVLQQKNQTLIAEAQERWEQMQKAATAANAKDEANRSTASGSVSASVGSDATTETAVQASSKSFRAELSAHKYAANKKQRPIRALPESDDNSLRCPICMKQFRLESVLLHHVNACLDRN